MMTDPGRALLHACCRFSDQSNQNIIQAYLSYGPPWANFLCWQLWRQMTNGRVALRLCRSACTWPYGRDHVADRPLQTFAVDGLKHGMDHVEPNQAY